MVQLDEESLNSAEPPGVLPVRRCVAEHVQKQPGHRKVKHPLQVDDVWPLKINPEHFIAQENDSRNCPHDHDAIEPPATRKLFFDRGAVCSKGHAAGLNEE